MQIDISRPPNAAAKHFSSVLHLQGRALMEADLNEQALILLHQLRTTVADLIGPAIAPQGAPGFEIHPVVDNGTVTNLRISPGRAYVEGILVENDIGEPGTDTTWSTYSTQPDGYLDLAGADKLPNDKPLAVYLRVWERAITAEQDPAIREIALGDLAPDTAARAKVIWQVAVAELSEPPPNQARFTAMFSARLAEFSSPTGCLAARARRPMDSDTDPCCLPPEAMYRGPENQLYRIEVHSGGPAWPDGQVADEGEFPGATFTWSRENASVVAPIESLNGAVAVLSMLGRDNKLAFEVGDWVQITDDAAASRVADDRPLATVFAAPALCQISAIDYASRTITLSDAPPADVGTRPELHPLVRRWDHTSPTLYDGDKTTVASDGALPLKEGVWITLEDGVEVQFSGPDEDHPGTYRSGDYWMIPARTVTGDVEWPSGADGPLPLPADGVTYHYAPLALVKVGGDTAFPRKTFKPQA
jgi:hypothetical protein